jgi:hypothetical protein
MTIRINLSGMILAPELVCDDCNEEIKSIDDAIVIIVLTKLDQPAIIHKTCKSAILRYKSIGNFVETDLESFLADLLSGIGLSVGRI